MKRPFALFLLSVAILLQGCQDDFENQTLEKINFTFILGSGDVSGGRSTSDLPLGTSLQLSLNDNNGKPVLTNHKIEILRLGEGYITQPLELTPGRYKIIDFMLVDESSEVLYLTPKRGSLLAAAVKHPLPYGFTVSRNKVTNVSMEVIDADSRRPEDFGYASFGIDVVHPWQIAVFIAVNGKMVLTDAKALLYRDSDLIEEYSLKSKTNVLGFRSETSVKHILEVKKGGFHDYRLEFIYNELMDKLDGKPLQVILQPLHDKYVFNFKTGDLIRFQFDIGVNESDEYIVDWGDGKIENILFKTIEQNFLTHEYKIKGQYEISIYGDLTNINAFVANPAIVEINTRNLSGLETLLLTYSYVLTYDLEHNPFIRQIGIGAINDSGSTVRLPPNHNIEYIDFNDSYVDNIDEVISNVYNNTIAKEIDQGVFSITNFHGPQPSSGSIEKLNFLSENYRWKITYAPN